MRDGVTSEECVGFSRDSEEFRVSSHRLRDFADVFADAGVRRSSDVCPAIFAHIPAMQTLVECVGHVTSEPAIHGEHDFVVLRPIKPGMRLTTKSTILGLKKSPVGQLILVESLTRDEAGETICQQVTSCILRNLEDAANHGQISIDRPDVSSISLEEVATVDIQPNLGAVYAEQARDYSPYTIDADAARAVGFDAPILHGICTLGLASEIAAGHLADDPVATFARLGCRFSAPLKLIAGQTLKVTAGRMGNTLSFCAVDGNGHPIVRNGYAELSS